MGQWAIFLAVSRKIVAGVVRIAMFAPVGTFWRKKFSKTWFFPQRFLDIEWKLDGFSRQIYSGIIKIAFYVSMGTIWEKKVLKEENFRQNFSFSTNWRKKLAGLPKSVPYVSIGDISRKTIFPEWKNFFIPQTLLGLFSSFFRLPGQKRILRAHRDILRKKFLSRKSYSSIISEYWAKNFWAILLQKLGGGGQNINLPYINILKKTLFRKEGSFCLFANFLQKNWFFVEYFSAYLSNLISTCQEEQCKEKRFFVLFWENFRRSCTNCSQRVKRNKLRQNFFLKKKLFLYQFWTMSYLIGHISETFHRGCQNWILCLHRIVFMNKEVFERKKFFLLILGNWVEIPELFSTNLQRNYQNCILLVDTNNFRKKTILKKKLFQKLSTLCRKKFSSVAKTAFNVSIGDISTKTIFSRKKNIFSLNKQLSAYCRQFINSEDKNGS